MSEQQQYRYSAFISYRHVERDRKWAEWLLNALETYRVPKELQKAGFPARLGKIFRDRDELPSDGSLNAQIEDALKASRFLVVICSPDTPRSRWVSREIEIFKELGRSDRIFPLLVEGEPDESFPGVLTTSQLVGFEEVQADPPVRDVEPIGADVRPVADKTEKETKRDELLRIVAGLLGCAYDDLKQRDKLRERKKRRNRLFAAAVSLIIIATGGLYYWDYNRIKTHYFKDYVTQWGVPQGLFPVDSKTQKQRYSTYAIDSRRNAIVAMRRINGSGGLLPLNGDGLDSEPWLKGVARWEYISNEKGQAQEVRLYGKTGKNLVTWDFDGPELVKFVKTAGKPFALDKNLTQLEGLGLAKGSNSDISQFRLGLDEHGRVTRIVFENAYGMPVSDSGNNFGRLYRRFPSGAIKKIHNTGKTGEIQISKKGVLAVEREFSRKGDLAKVAWTTENGNLHVNDNGYAFMTLVYKQGNAVEISYLDTEGKLTFHKKGCAKKYRVYDAHGNMTEQACFGVNGEPVLNKRGIAKLVHAYDAHGNRTEQMYFGVDGEPVLVKQGFSKVALVYDVRGNVTEQKYYAVDGKPTLHEDGYAKLVWVYDERGNVSEIEYFGVDGKPTLRKGGYARVTQIYESRGNVIDQKFFGVDGKPVLNKDGYARLTRVYDARGNVDELAYFDINGEPTLHNDGYARLTQTNDSRGNLVALAYFDINGEPVQHKDGYARLAQVYDEHGNIKEVEYYGVDGRPVLGKDEYARFTQVYDTRGNLIEQEYFGVDGKPTLHKEGYAKLTRVYDSRGNPAEQKLFGVGGKPTLGKNHYAKAELTYDVRGNLVQGAYYDIDGKPVLRKGGYARITRKYDSRGNITEEAYFDIDGKPVLMQEGFAKLVHVFDERGNLAVREYYGVDEELILNKNGYARVVQIHDARGRVVEASYFDVDEEPVSINNGYAKVIRVLGAHGNVVKTSYFGPDGKPALFGGEYSSIVWGYDARGRGNEISYYGASGKPVLNKKGYAKIFAVYDARGQITKETYVGIDGKPVLVHGGYASIYREYDLSGGIVLELFSGVDGKPIISSQGFSQARGLRDGRGRLVDERYFGVNGEPVERRSKLSPAEEIKSPFDKWRVVILRNVHDKDTLSRLADNTFSVIKQGYGMNNFLESQKYFHSDGSAAPGFDGFSEVKVAYNSLNLPELFVASFPDAGKEQIKIRMTYTPRYRAQHISFLDSQDKPRVGSMGFSEINYVYDEAGRLVKTQYIDDRGAIVSEQGL